MSRKHYVRIAAIILTIDDIEIRQRVASEFADMFQEDNAFFDRARFLSASGAEVW